jgi:hypothetical protein
MDGTMTADVEVTSDVTRRKEKVEKNGNAKIKAAQANRGMV